jgi:molybdopterin converting factor small subunit
MHVECHFFGPYRDAVGRKEVAYDVDPDATVGDLLAAVESDVPDLDGDLLDESEVADSVVVTLDGRHVQFVGGADATLEEDSVVRVTTAVYGG